MQISYKTAPELNQMKLTFGNRAMSDSQSLGAGCLWANLSERICAFIEGVYR